MCSQSCHMSYFWNVSQRHNIQFCNLIKYQFVPNSCIWSLACTKSKNIYSCTQKSPFEVGAGNQKQDGVGPVDNRPSSAPTPQSWGCHGEVVIVGTKFSAAILRVKAKIHKQSKDTVVFVWVFSLIWCAHKHSYHYIKHSRSWRSWAVLILEFFGLIGFVAFHLSYFFCSIFLYFLSSKSNNPL